MSKKNRNVPARPRPRRVEAADLASEFGINLEDIQRRRQEELEQQQLLQNTGPIELETPRAPYNFVPFHDYPVYRYKSMDKLPKHDIIDSLLLSGEIKVRITAETPIFVSNGEGKTASDGKRNEDDVDFFRGADGNYQIPGSTVRGLIRENMQILGFGLVRPGQDYENTHFYFRAIANANGSVGEALRNNYRMTLGIPANTRTSIAQNVKSGWLHHGDDDEYYIAPCNGEPVYIPRDSEMGRKLIKLVPIWDKVKKDKENPSVVEHEKVIQTQFIPAWISLKDNKVLDIICENSKNQPPAGYIHGCLLSVGYMYRQNTLYFFMDEMDEDSDKGKHITLSQREIQEYKDDWSMRENQLPGTDKNCKMDAQFWNLPDKGEAKPVFYVQPDSKHDAGGKEKENTATEFGMCRFMRIRYSHGEEDGVPRAHRDVTDRTAAENAEPYLDYPYSLMGFAEAKYSYKSRVRVGDFKANGDACTEQGFKVVLAGPKPEFYAGYLTGPSNSSHRNNNNGRRKVYHYNDPDFRLRGHKHYWLKPAEKPELPNDNDKVATELRPLPAGTVFTGTIRYSNLHEDELGLLLWCIRLNAGCRQSIGMGKPYGYGQISVQIEGLYEQSISDMYKSFNVHKPEAASGERIDELIKEYKTNARKLLIDQRPNNTVVNFRSIDETPVIRSLLKMRSSDNSGEYAKNAAYMPLDGFRNLPEPLKLALENNAPSFAAQKRANK